MSADPCQEIADNMQEISEAIDSQRSANEMGVMILMQLEELYQELTAEYELCQSSGTQEVISARSEKVISPQAFQQSLKRIKNEIDKCKQHLLGIRELIKTIKE